MIYTKLIEALLVGDSRGISEYSQRVCELLVDYLKLRMMAEEADAQDASQQTMLLLFEMGSDQKIDNSQYAASYILKMLRNEYYRLMKSRRTVVAEKIEPYMEQHSLPNQIEDFKQDERKIILDKCVEKLSEKNKELFYYLAQNPDHSIEYIARSFKISISNASTRKSRLMKILRKCVGSRKNGKATSVVLKPSDFLRITGGS
jgi:RNA polymerase sigma factor (sigma-70 family)